jgi:large subunit ribosomal protein L6
MSRIGRMPVAIPAGVDVKLDAANVMTVKGPKGTLTEALHKNMKINIDGAVITVERPDDEKQNRSLHGLTRSLIANMVEGVVNGYKKELEVNGVGYRAQKQGKQLVLNLGYSHNVVIEEEPGITFEVPDANKIIISGPSKQRVGQVAAEIRSKRPPEPYLGKGIKYVDEHIRRKSGKAGK